MNRWFRKNYRVFSGLFLVVVFIGWTSFLNRSEIRAAEVKVQKEDTVIADGTMTPAPTTTPEPEVKQDVSNEAEIKPADEVVIEKTQVPTDEPINDVPVQEDPVQNDTSQDVQVEPTAEPIVEVTPEPVIELVITFPYAVANVEDRLNIRSDAGEEFPAIATMTAKTYCEVLEWGPEWTKIKSGSITGYASTKFLLFNEECIARMQHLNTLLVKVTSNILNIRQEPNTECTVLDKAYTGHKYMYLPEQSVEGWYCIQYSETQVGYMSAEFCQIFINMETAVQITD